VKKLLVLCCLAIVGVGRAAIIPIGLFPPVYQETFDSMAPGPYTAFPVFAATGAMAAFNGPGDIYVGPPIAFLSAPNGAMGIDADALIKESVPMRAFGGYFESGFSSTGVVATAVTFKFYDAGGVLIGTVTHPLTFAWTWIGYATIPKWAVVKIEGNASSPGFVVMDNLRAAP
jgi:hypothetical protein